MHAAEQDDLLQVQQSGQRQDRKLRSRDHVWRLKEGPRSVLGMMTVFL